MPKALGTTLLLFLVLGSSPLFASAQIADQHRWTLTAGREMLTIRDVSRSGFPIQTSPVGLEGDAWLFGGRYEARAPRRAHTFVVALSRNGSMDVRTPVATLAEDGHRASRLEGRYEYRWILLRDRLAPGLSIDAGLVGLAAWQSVVTETPPSNRIGMRDAEAGAGGMVGLRLQRWGRVELESAWTMALVMGRTTEDVVAGRVNRDGRTGGGWLLDSRTGGSVRLSDRLWLSVAYTSVGQARFASHRGQSDRRGKFEVGVTHVR